MLLPKTLPEQGIWIFGWTHLMSKTYTPNPIGQSRSHGSRKPVPLQGVRLKEYAFRNV